MSALKTKLKVDTEFADEVRAMLWLKTDAMWEVKASSIECAIITEVHTGKGFTLSLGCSGSYRAGREPDRYQLQGEYLQPTSGGYALYSLLPTGFTYSTATCAVTTGIEGIVKTYFRMCARSYDATWLQTLAIVNENKKAFTEKINAYEEVQRIFGTETRQYNGFKKEIQNMDIPYGNVEITSASSYLKLGFDKDDNELLYKVLRAVRDTIADHKGE